MNTEKEQELLDLCFPRLYGRFSELVNNFGGKLVAEKFKETFLAHATGKGFKQGGGFDLIEASVDWEEYRNLMSELIEFTIGVAGKKTVGKEIQAAIREVEEKTGENLYEIGFKLNLNKYMEN